MSKSLLAMFFTSSGVVNEVTTNTKDNNPIVTTAFFMILIFFVYDFYLGHVITKNEPRCKTKPGTKKIYTKKLVCGKTYPIGSKWVSN